MAYLYKKGRFNNKEKGGLGEEIACRLLVKRGFRVVRRNYRKVWGEIDIIAEKDNILHFFEVKSVTFIASGNFETHHPEDNVHRLKMKHISRMIETYLDEEENKIDSEFYFHVLCVYMNMETRKAKVKMIENIIL